MTTIILRFPRLPRLPLLPHLPLSLPRLQVSYPLMTPATLVVVC
jgi:hypothetical protein